MTLFLQALTMALSLSMAAQPVAASDCGPACFRAGAAAELGIASTAHLQLAALAAPTTQADVPQSGLPMTVSQAPQRPSTPSILPNPIPLQVRRIEADDDAKAPILKFAQTAARNWNFDRHDVPIPFSENQGYWTYEDCPAHYAVWLFDRPSAWFKLFELTGSERFKQLGISDLKYWADKITPEGSFSCKSREADTKYLELEAFVFYETFTGDRQYRALIDKIYLKSAAGFAEKYTPTVALWTERELGIHLGAAVDYFRLTSNENALMRAGSLVNQWTDMAGRGNGAPQVTYTQHEGGGPGGTTPMTLTNSPWMSAMYFQAARRYWQITGDDNVLKQASDYFDWLDENAFYDGGLAHPQFAGITIPRYLTGPLIGEAGYSSEQMLHCPDVEGFISFAVLAKSRLNLPVEAAQRRRREMQSCANRMWSVWTRSGGDSSRLPKYRIQAPRAFNWWLRGLYEASLVDCSVVPWTTPASRSVCRLQ